MEELVSPIRHTAFLVSAGEIHALVDAVGERVFMLNREGAQVWRELMEGLSIRMPEATDFVAELIGFGLVSEQTARPKVAPAETGRSVPRVLSQSPLNVQANAFGPGLPRAGRSAGLATGEEALD